MMVFIDETTKGKTMNLNEMTVTELRKLAAQFKITGRSTMKKAELIDALSAPEIAERIELHQAIDQIDDGAQARFAEQATAAGIRSANDTEDTNTKALVTRDVPGAAFFDINGGPSGVIVRSGRRFELVTGSGETITLRARTMVKALKRLAVRLGITLSTIEVQRTF